MSAKHTPGPMTYGHLGQNSFWFGPDHESKPVAIIPWDCSEARDEARENAAEMKRRWNAHPGVLEILKELRTALLADHGAGGGLPKHTRERAADMVREAIAKAEGRS